MYLVETRNRGSRDSDKSFDIQSASREETSHGELQPIESIGGSPGGVLEGGIEWLHLVLPGGAAAAAMEK